MHSFSNAHCLAAEEVAEVALPFTGRRPVLGFAQPYAGSPMHLAVSCSTSFCLWTGSSSQVASHPVPRRRSFLRLRTASVLSDGDFHPTVGAHSQAHVGMRSRASGVACLEISVCGLAIALGVRPRRFRWPDDPKLRSRVRVR